MEDTLTKSDLIERIYKEGIVTSRYLCSVFKICYDNPQISDYSRFRDLISQELKKRKLNVTESNIGIIVRYFEDNPISSQPELSSHL